jgi:transcriptional regulator with XRE-family HTH domain
MTSEAQRFGAQVRFRRRAREMTQAQLAERAGVSRATIARIETGEANPDLDTMSKIARGLGVPTAELLEG